MILTPDLYFQTQMMTTDCGRRQAWNMLEDSEAEMLLQMGLRMNLQQGHKTRQGKAKDIFMEISTLFMISDLRSFSLSIFKK